MVQPKRGHGTQDRLAHRRAVARFQQTAFWDLGTRLANSGIVIGVLALLTVMLGNADGARLAPTLLCVSAGVCAGAVYFSRPYPKVAKYLLLISAVLVTLGILGLVAVVQVLER